MLTIKNLTAHYGAAQALFGIDMEIEAGQTVALVGANGAGKSTLLKCVMGLVRPSGGEILLEGKSVTGSSPARMVRHGLALSPEGREVFAQLSVFENLQLGAIPLSLAKAEETRRMDEVFARFPKLRERRQQLAGTLSGGEQQMLAMGRALMASPRLLLLDEPSLGLAPRITDEIFSIIHQLSRSGTTILIVEQNAARALSASDTAYLLAGGKIVEQGKSRDLLLDPALRAAFLGAASQDNPSASRLGAAGLTNIRLEKLPMHTNFMPSFNSGEELEAHQLRGLQWTIRHAFEGSPAYRAKLEAAGVTPESIQSLDDLRRLPFTTTDDLRDGYPFPLKSVPFEQLVRVHASSGTTGKRKVLCYTQKDLDDWTDMFARCYQSAGITPLDRVQIAVGYGVWTAGMGFQLGCEKVGALAVPVGPGNIDMHIQFLLDFQSTVFCSTASMALLMAEEIHKRGIADKIAVRKIIYGSERSSRSMRKKISELFGGAELFDITGLTELYGPGAGIECSDHDCIHYWGDYYLMEILDPETLAPMPEGEWGEMVITTLCKEGSPLIRYRTRDITRIIPGPCTCGSIMPRHSRIKGRSDDTIKFRGVNIYPSSIDTILSAVPGLGSEYQIHLTRGDGGRDHLRLVVERAEGVAAGRGPELIHEAGHQIKRQLMVTVELELVDYGSLPRSDRKIQRVFDSRIQDEIV
ncbi:MAG: ATP-binding cassette domain-containing protein [Desulfomicrobium sp.]|nr:ATP-binding cassette domain-containing protein [Pseudomonadota bacterium]MBV1713429.1 ATP-binding cassette domain-containing protein [Desulfomicrobium sp.]MBU4570437.1 ATP-binding cassette domain-containing protein [Pseudomonadota bacterium]MBU4593794.1 ATP-binding cassette domain-containing protein [Pseudomonadota bacterium]MBV1719752.1 ATP-binding cassette domain-containing protein [Desulfomicrobium sp.]